MTITDPVATPGAVFVHVAAPAAAPQVRVVVSVHVYSGQDTWLELLDELLLDLLLLDELEELLIDDELEELLELLLEELELDELLLDELELDELLLLELLDLELLELLDEQSMPAHCVPGPQPSKALQALHSV